MNGFVCAIIYFTYCNKPKLGKIPSSVMYGASIKK